LLEKSGKSIKISEDHLKMLLKASYQDLPIEVALTSATKAISEVDGYPELGLTN